MSNLPPNPYNSFPGPPKTNANVSTQGFNHNQPIGHGPLNQLPPGYGGVKQDPNSNSPLHTASGPQNSSIQHVNNYNQSTSSSPAFNQSGMMSPVQQGLQSSPMRSPMSGAPNSLSNPVHNAPLTSGSPRIVPNANPSPSPYPSNFLPQQHQINDNAPPLIPSSQTSQPLVNGPLAQPGPVGPPLSQYPVSSSGYSSPPGGKVPVSSGYVQGMSNAPLGPLPPTGPLTKPPLGPHNASQPTIPFSTPPITGPLRHSPLVPGPPVSGPPAGMTNFSGPPTGQHVGPPRPVGVNGPHLGGLPINPPTSESLIGSSRPVPSGFSSGPMRPTSAATMGQPLSGPPLSGPPLSGPPLSGPPLSGPPLSGPPLSGPPLSGPPLSGPPLSGPPLQSYPGQSYKNGPSGQPLNPPGPSAGHIGPPGSFIGPQSQAIGSSVLQGPQDLPPIGQQMVAPPGPMAQPSVALKSNMQSRYPQMAPGTYMNHQQPQTAQQSNLMKQYPQQYGHQGLTQQMGQLSVTKQGFDQLWGHHMVDLLQCKHILPEYPEDPPEIKLGHQFAESPNCSPEIFRCTVNRIPETNNLLQKSRLPLGILIHPFKDLNHLPVIQCTTIVRCRACRTYINPFVYFVDAKRWKCNLCYRVNDLPEEFQYDPVSKSYGDPSRRPEIKSATIEFIAPGEYMLRPPQPAVYLFLFDVSQLARESGYLQVVCDTLKTCLEQLPGDARTQIGFICYDAHVHYYLMSEGLTRPKEMTILDIDDVFLPSPSSLLVNLGERRELVRELLTSLRAPRAPAAPAPSACALGAALQAAYKLMAPTGGRITVFQTCLPNVGPGALQPREDPNARSSKEVAHLNPATDFYKRLALDCSGAQIAVDLFLLNSQYADLATLSGISKFSAGTVYHLPLFNAARQWQADQLNRMFTRYLTRKIGFEAVMRVRCTRGIAIHTFHGNFFVRSTDLLSLPNVSPDAGFGMQLTIEESLSDLQQVCFQAALLYTSSKGERRIRVHTLALPTASNLTDVLHSADQQCIIGLLSKMAVDRCAAASLGEAREALTTVAVDALSAFRLAQNLPAGPHGAALHAPASLRLLPLYLLALLKRKAFRTGTSTRLDDRVSDMCALKCAALAQLMRGVYPDLYCITDLSRYAHSPPDDDTPDPPRLQLSAERINSTGAYLLDDGECMLMYICHAVSPAFLSETFGVAAFVQLPDEQRTLPRLESEASELLHAFIDKLNDDRPYPASLLVLRDNSPNRTLFTERLIEDRVESAFSYYEFLQHVKTQVK